MYAAQGVAHQDRRLAHVQCPQQLADPACSCNGTTVTVRFGRPREAGPVVTNDRELRHEITSDQLPLDARPAKAGVDEDRRSARSEERRVGKEWRSPGAPRD